MFLDPHVCIKTSHVSLISKGRTRCGLPLSTGIAGRCAEEARRAQGLPRGAVAYGVMVPAHSHSREATRAGRRGVLFEIKL